VKLRQRYDIIRLYLSERPKPEIAAILDISLTQVYLIVNLYKRLSVEGLELTPWSESKTDRSARGETAQRHYGKTAKGSRLRAILQLDSAFSV
jgi:hypothetical protein